MSENKYPTRIDLVDGKYTLIFDFSAGQSECLRYGQPWRQLAGDKLLLGCFDEIVEARRQRDELLAALSTQAAKDVIAERHRQQAGEGWTPEHDDAHVDGQMAVAAGYYALACGFPHERGIGGGRIPLYWPWDKKWWKPSDKRRNLVKAAALILAEIERIDRAASASVEGGAA